MKSNNPESSKGPSDDQGPKPVAIDLGQGDGFTNLPPVSGPGIPKEFSPAGPPTAVTLKFDNGAVTGGFLVPLTKDGGEPSEGTPDSTPSLSGTLFFSSQRSGSINLVRELNFAAPEAELLKQLSLIYLRLEQDGKFFFGSGPIEALRLKLSAPRDQVSEAVRKLTQKIQALIAPDSGQESFAM